MFYSELGADLPHREWRCNSCGATNSCLDGECQFCECGGLECRRSSCSGPQCGQCMAPEELAAARVAQGGAA
jgi:hypothetical protein